MKDTHVTQSENWLIKIQNKDGGWGMYEHSDSRIVTTAEAVTALAIAGVAGDPLHRGIDYLITNSRREDWCKYTRHHAWTIYALIRSGHHDEIPDRCLQTILTSHVNGGWGHGSNGYPPSVFASFLAWRVVSELKQHMDLAELSCQWFLQTSATDYWTLSNMRPSLAATSYAVLVLTSQNDWKNKYEDRVKKAITYLRSNTEHLWSIEHEPGISDDFHHCVLPWVLMAMLSAEISVFDSLVIEAFNRLYNDYYCKTTGGWAEEKNRRPSVFGTSHAIAAIEMFYQVMNMEQLLNRVCGEAQQISQSRENNYVFIVHGHDKATQQEVARFVERSGCEAIILNEQVNFGLTTIFQKFVEYANRAAFAIVLMTPDDIVEAAGGDKAARARQNVIYELGYFTAKLGPGKVCLAKRGDVEIPSDISGVIYLNLDDGGWKLNLAKEMKQAGLPVNPEGLLQG